MMVSNSRALNHLDPYFDAETRGRLAQVDGAIAALWSRVDELPASSGVSVLVSSADLDRLLAALTIAIGAASMGGPASLFFSFWGVAALRKPDAKSRARSLLERLLGWLLPCGASSLGLSRMHMGGVGTSMLKRRMHDKNIPGVDALFAMAAECGVRLYVCTTTLELMGLALDDLIDYPSIEACGVSAFLSTAYDSRLTLTV